MSTGNSSSRRPSPATAAPAGPRVKIVDVAREAGVSITTVSHALNGRGQVDPKTRELVGAVARRLGYRPNRHAQQLRRSSAQVIALVSSMPFAVAGGPARLGFMMEIAAVAASVALERGLALVLVFIGTKMCLVDFYKIPVLVSLGVVAGILVVTMLLSVRSAKAPAKI